MDSKEDLAVILDLMEKLQDKMQYGEEDFNDRLGRKKPEVQVMSIEGESPMGGDEEPDGDEMPPMMGDDMDEDPDEALKRRLMQMRG